MTRKAKSAPRRIHSLMITEAQMDTLEAGQPIESKPLPFDVERTYDFNYAKSPERSCEVTCAMTGPGTCRLIKA